MISFAALGDQNGYYCELRVNGECSNCIVFVQASVFLLSFFKDFIMLQLEDQLQKGMLKPVQPTALLLIWFTREP